MKNGITLLFEKPHDMKTRQIIAVLFVPMTPRKYIKIKWNIFKGFKFRFKVNVLFFVFYFHKNNYKLFRLLISCFLLFSLLPQCFNGFILWPSLGVQSVWKRWPFFVEVVSTKAKGDYWSSIMPFLTVSCNANYTVSDQYIWWTLFEDLS